MARDPRPVRIKVCRGEHLPAAPEGFAWWGEPASTRRRKTKRTRPYRKKIWLAAADDPAASVLGTITLAAHGQCRSDYQPHGSFTLRYAAISILNHWGLYDSRSEWQSDWL